MFSDQRIRLLNLLKIRPVTCEDSAELGIAGSALPRRIKDLKDVLKLNIEIRKKEYVRKFDGKKVRISEYVLKGGDNA